MERRIGVYICHCGGDISSAVDVAELAEFARGLDSVVIARSYAFMCSDQGQELLKQDIKQKDLNRVVVVACSPQLHEPTFRRALDAAGLNPYLLAMVNIREQCSWLTEGKEKATEKARAMVSGAVRRVFHHEPLQARELPVNPSTLVVGGGIAGIQAALEIARAGHKVYLVEREPSLGGHMMQLDRVSPTLDSAASILTPRMAELRTHEHVELMTYCEVASVSGHVGNFKVKIREKPRYVDKSKCIGCGVCQLTCPQETASEFDAGLGTRKAIYTPFPQAVPGVPVIDVEHCAYFLDGSCQDCQRTCEAHAIDFTQQERSTDVEVGSIIIATGFDVLDPSPLSVYGYGRLPNVITGMQFERMSSPTGPTGGKIQLRDGREPDSIAIIHCVGSRDKSYHEYCSQVCCMYSMKFAHTARERTGAQVYEFYIDLRCFGKGAEEFYNRALQQGTTFIRGRPGEVTDVAEKPGETGKLIVQFEDTLVSRQCRLPVDMVILSTALEPRSDTAELGKLFSLGRSADGFFLERHPKLDPVATAYDGVFIAGCCQGPKDVADTVTQASAAAARVLATISEGKVTLEPVVAVVDEKLCSGCKICLGICPCAAISFIEESGVAGIDEARCTGCGICVAACPTSAISGQQFSDEQVIGEIEGILA